MFFPDIFFSGAEDFFFSILYYNNSRFLENLFAEPINKFRVFIINISMAGKELFEYPYTPNYFVTPYGRIHYLREGEGDVVVCVHGNPTWSYYYRNLVAALRKTHCVIAPDHLGCGLSDKPQDFRYTLDSHIENLQSLLNHLGVQRFSLVMHDWGGAIGMGLAARLPEQVEKLVILNTAAFRADRIPLRIQLCKVPVVGELLVRGLNGFAWPATFMAVTKKMRKEIALGYLAPYNNWHNRIAIHRFVADIPLKKADHSYACLREVERGLAGFAGSQQKILLLWGGRDFCFNDYFYEKWRTIFPQCRHCYLADAGHYVLEDAKDEAIGRIVTFFTENG